MLSLQLLVPVNPLRAPIGGRRDTLSNSPLELTAGLLQVTSILEVTGLPEVNGLLAITARVQYYTNTSILKSGANV
jgi:hypothetical protein